MLFILAALVPWSLWRQTHERPVTPASLVKLPLVFAAIGVIGMGRHDVPVGAGAAAYVAAGLGLSVVLGLWRGAVIPLWRTADDGWRVKGNALTITLWLVLFAVKIAGGTIAHLEHWHFPSEASDVFLTFAISFAAQNAVIARRTLGGRVAAAPA